MNPLYTLIVRAALSVGFVIGYSLIVVTVLKPGVEFSPSAEKVLIFLLGALTTSVVAIVQFWFGSTQSSADKDRLLHDRDDGQNSGV